MYKSIDIDREKLTIMGVQFSDLKTLESTANAIGTNMFEGYIPTTNGVEVIRDYLIGKISLNELVDLAKEKVYV
jgi:putative transcriptional regulator